MKLLKVTYEHRAYTEDEAKDTQQPLLKVSNGGGYYVDGSISELEKLNAPLANSMPLTP